MGDGHMTLPVVIILAIIAVGLVIRSYRKDKGNCP